MSAAQIQPGETILIVGAAGAVGQAATQIANWKQARVIGADTTSDPLPGTESVVNTKTEGLRERVLEMTAIPTNTASAHFAVKRSGMNEKQEGSSQIRLCVLISDVHRLD